jgi:hypothetical protein
MAVLAGVQLNIAPSCGALQIAARFLTSAQKVNGLAIPREVIAPLHLEGYQGATLGGALAHFTASSS